MHFPSILRQRSLPAERQLCYLQSSERTGKSKQFGLPASHSATWDPMPMSTHLQEGKDTSSQAFLAWRNRRRQHPTNTTLGVSWDWNIEWISWTSQNHWFPMVSHYPLANMTNRLQDNMAPFGAPPQVTLASISSNVLSKGFSGSIPSWVHQKCGCDNYIINYIIYIYILYNYTTMITQPDMYLD